MGDEEMVVYCRTEELVNRVLRIADDLGLTWWDKSSTVIIDPEILELIRNPNWGFCLLVDNREISFCSLAYFEYHSYEIKTAEDFIREHEEAKH